MHDNPTTVGLKCHEYVNEYIFNEDYLMHIKALSGCDLIKPKPVQARLEFAIFQLIGFRPQLP